MKITKKMVGKEILSVAEYALRIGKTTIRVYQLIASGDVKSIRSGKTVLVIV